MHGEESDDEHLTEAFAYLGLTLFTAYFLNYAETELDLLTGPPAAQRGKPKDGIDSGSHPH